MQAISYQNRSAPEALDPAIALLGNEPAGASLHFAADRHWVRDIGTPANSKLGTTTELITSGHLTFARASAAWGVGRLGLIEQFAANVPRLVYDQTTLITSAATIQFRPGVTALTVTTEYTFAAGEFAALTDSGNTARWMRGRVISHVGTLLVVDIYWIASGVSGSASSWAIIKSLGYLPEPQATNLTPYSNLFSASPWTVSNASLAQNSAIAPDGTLTAPKLVESNTNSSHILRVTEAFAASTNYTLSVFARAGERSIFTLLVLDNGGAGGICSAHFDLAAGTAVIASNALGITRSIEKFGGWYRCCVTFTSSAAPSGSYWDFRMSDGAPGNTGDLYAGDGTSGMYFCGAQREIGDRATSPIPTFSSAVTRSSDALRAVASKLPGLGTAFTSISTFNYTIGVTNGAPVGLYTDNANRSAISASANGQISAFVRIGDVVTSTFTGASGAPARSKAAMSVGGGILDFVVNGALINSGASAQPPAPAFIELGFRSAGSQLSAPLENVILIPRKLSQAEMIARTA